MNLHQPLALACTYTPIIISALSPIPCNFQASLWILDAGWHVLCYMILVAICYLWSPSKSNMQYSHSDELPAEEDVAEDV